MAAFAGDGQTLSGEQLQPEVMMMCDFIEGKAQLDFRTMPHHKAYIIRAMIEEFWKHLDGRKKPSEP